MSLQFRLAQASDYPRLEDLVIQSFEPITWIKTADQEHGPFNGHNWRQWWQFRFQKVFETQTVLVGQDGAELVAMASGTLDGRLAVGYIDLLAVDQRHRGKGYGRQMLRGMLAHMKAQGMVHAHLECLTTNDTGNALYRAEGFQEVARSIRWFIRIP